MNKRTFTVEIKCQNAQDAEILASIRVQDLISNLAYGMAQDGFYPDKISFVEQTCGTLDFTEKAIDLLKRASDSLNYYCTELNGDMNDGLANEIDKFLSGKE